MGDFFNWLFVVRDPFYLLPKDIAPFVMPPVVVILFTLADLGVYSVYFGIKSLGKERIRCQEKDSGPTLSDRQ